VPTADLAPECCKEIIRDARARLRTIGERTRTCVERLSPEELTWRPNAESNSVANLVLHVCGNLRQRFHAGFGEAADDRDRDSEFDSGSAEGAAKAALLDRLRTAYAEVDAVLAAAEAEPARLAEIRHIQGEDQNLAHVLLFTIGHCSEHYGQIAYVAKARLGQGFASLSIPRRA
jgi:uncharacterized damage-inducible protein DinB